MNVYWAKDNEKARDNVASMPKIHGNFISIKNSIFETGNTFPLQYFICEEK